MILPDRVHHWLTQSALPLWADIGVDREQGGFVERLLPNGSPDWAAPKRVRVQARQLYVYSHAHVLGMMPGADAIASQAYEFLLRHACPQGIDAGFVHSVSRVGMVIDSRRDSYDHAFLLFAFSWYYRASHRRDVKAVILDLDAAIQRLLRHPNGPGYLLDDQGSLALHQNPHMHLFEAVLAAFDATGDARFLDRANEIFSIFRNHMFEHEAGALREYYDGNWCPASGDEGQIVEPGHHCEWIWLLKWYADRIGQPLSAEAYALDAFTQRYGFAPLSGRVCDEVDTQGRMRRSTTRSWPQAEALKAQIALAEARDTPLDPRADAIVESLFATYLDRPIPGTWVDWVDDRGEPLVHTIPASTFYHIFLAFSEYLRVQSDD